MRTVRLAPSILTADFARLAEAVQAAEAGGADMLHLDVMDGHFVPPITFGAVLVDALRQVTSLPFDMHLMVDHPERHIEAYAATASTINVHVEATPHIHRVLGAIRAMGLEAGVCLNPGTPIAAIEPVLEEVDQVVVMAVNPGWGGQPFIPSQLDKVRQLRDLLDRSDHQARIEIDGGVKLQNAAQCARAGADVLVCGSSVYNKEASPQDNLAALRDALKGETNGP
jgi:ribulose-phosphate 3-epimerase